MLKLILGITIVFVVVCSVKYVSAKGVERQKYQLIESVNGIEIRYYPKAIMATVTDKTAHSSYMQGSNGMFRRLAGYIFGGNKESVKIAMTAPVHIVQDTTESKMSFVMPASANMDKLPQPDDAGVNIHYSKEGYYAAIKFGGYASDAKINKKIAQLKKALSTLGYTTMGKYSYLGYNAPWDVINRENEVIVEIQYTPKK